MQLTVLVVNWWQVLFLWTVKFNLEPAYTSLWCNGKRCEKAPSQEYPPKGKDDGKAQLMQIMGLIRQMFI